MRMLLTLGLSLTLLLAVGVARADPPPYRLPPPLPQPAPEAPGRAPDDIPRRRYELSLMGSVAALGCHGDAPSDTATPDPCAHLGVGPRLRLEAMWRVIPFLAIGATASVTRFSWDASRGLGEPASSFSGSWTHVGAVARGYLFEDGTFDPWLGVSLGVGYLAMRGGANGVSDELWRNGFETTGEFGVDTWVSGRMRIGAVLGFDFEPGGGVERCTGSSCLDASSAVTRIPDHAFHGGVSVTVALGPEL